MYKRQKDGYSETWREEKTAFGGERQTGDPSGERDIKKAWRWEGQGVLRDKMVAHVAGAKRGRRN